MNFDEDFKKYLTKIKKNQGQLNEFAEEQTKNALVMPLFSILGYDVFDPNEFMPEFTCDVATKKGEKVDYAILKDGEPIIIIEVKKASMKLQKQQQGQLFRYFSTNRCRIAILTNGITYQIFSDLNAPNIMDDEPFLSFNILEDDPAIYSSSLKQFHKEIFDVKNILSKAIYQKYEKVVEKTLIQDLICPSDELVKYFLSREEIKTGSRITAQMIQRHRDATQKAMQKVFKLKIRDIADKNSDSPKKIDSKTISEDNDTVIPEPVPNAISEEKEPVSVQSISEKINNICQECVPDYRFQQEDNSEFVRIHIYTTSNRKLGIAKIMKSDCSLQFKKIGSDYCDLNTVDDIKSYI